jgi:hypothetical protein
MTRLWLRYIVTVNIDAYIALAIHERKSARPDGAWW